MGHIGEALGFVLLPFRRRMGDSADRLMMGDVRLAAMPLAP